MLLLGISVVFSNVAIASSVSVVVPVFAVYFLSIVFCFRSFNKVWRVYGKVVKYIPAFIILFFITNVMNECGYNTPLFPFSIFMCFVLMLTLLVHSIYDRVALLYCIYGIAFGGILMSIFFALGIGYEIDEGRLIMFGENSNVLGVYMGLSSIVCLNSFILKDDLHIGKIRFLFSVAFVFMVNLLLATGSRTAFLIFAMSIIIIVCFNPIKSKFGKFLFIIVGIIAVVYAFNSLLTRDSVLIQRLATTMEDGNVSGRDSIIESLIPYLWDSPIFGYGQTGYVNIAKQALGRVSVIGGIVYGYSPHNVIIELLFYTGIIGLFLWLLFWWNIGKESWILFYKKRLLMPGLMCIPMLACIISGQILDGKWAYVLYAYIMSEYHYLRRA